MATFHISEAEAARDFAGLLARVRAGAEVVIQDAASADVVLRTAEERPLRRLSESLHLAKERGSIEECIALLPADSSATIDEEFAGDVAAAVASHREPRDASA